MMNMELNKNLLVLSIAMTYFLLIFYVRVYLVLQRKIYNKHMIYIHHYGTKGNSPQPPRSFFCLVIYSFPLTPSGHWLFHCLCSFAFSRMLHCWNHSVYHLFSLNNMHQVSSMSFHDLSALFLFFLFVSEQFSFIWTCHSLSIHSPYYRTCSCFHVVTMMNRLIYMLVY